MAGAYLGNEEKQKATEVLEHYLTTDPSESRIKTMLAGMYLENDTNKAIAAYVDVVKKQPENVIAHNNLAWLYHDKNDLDKALQHAKKAYEIAPHIPNVADTYGKVLLSSGDKRGALKHASKASELTKGQDIDIQLNYIETLIANSRSNEAKALLNKLPKMSEEQENKKTKLQTQL